MDSDLPQPRSEEEVIRMNLNQWVSRLRRFVDEFNATMKDVDSLDSRGDRMEKIMKAMYLLSIIENIVADFKNWLMSPQVSTFITDELLDELFTDLQQVAHRMLATDATHTGKFAEEVVKNIDKHMPILKLIYKMEMEKQGIQIPQPQEQQEYPRYL
jgi:hypothetical protein